MQRLQQAYREQRLARYEQVIALRKLGMSHAAIAKRVGIGQSTVGNWLAAGAYPETTRGPYVIRFLNDRVLFSALSEINRLLPQA